MLADIADEGIGHLRDVHKTALAAGERDKSPKLGDTADLTLEYLADFPIHGFSSLSLFKLCPERPDPTAVPVQPNCSRPSDLKR